MIAGVYRGEITAREHQILLECALKRDAATAIAVLKVHIEACVDFTLANGTYDFSSHPYTDCEPWASVTSSSPRARLARTPSPKG